MKSRLGPRRTVHHAGTYMLLIATIMHLIPVITIPLTSMDLLKAENRAVSLDGGYPVVRMGTFGYCVSIRDSPEGDKPEVCRMEWGYDVSELTWPPDTKFSLYAASNNTNINDNDNNNNGNDSREGYMGRMTGLVMILNPFSFAVCAVAFLVSLAISVCFITSSYIVTWVVSAVAAFATAAAAAADYRWASYVRDAVADHASSAGASPGSVRYGIGAATLSVALVVQIVVAVTGFFVCCLERRSGTYHKTTASSSSSSSSSGPGSGSGSGMGMSMVMGSRKKNKERNLERMKQIDDDRLYDDESLDGEDTTYRPPKSSNGYRGLSNV